MPAPVAESLSKGQRVVATGRLKQRQYEDREGVTRTVVELDVEEIGPSLSVVIEVSLIVNEPGPPWSAPRRAVDKWTARCTWRPTARLWDADQRSVRTKLADNHTNFNDTRLQLRLWSGLWWR